MSRNRKQIGVLATFLYVGIMMAAQAQYHPTLTYNKEWLIKTCEFGNCLHDYYYFSEDTVIDGTFYKMLDGYHYGKNFFLREDLIERQVFLLINDGTPFLEEYLLYDYGMKVGDSIYLRNPISPVSGIEGFYHLDSIVPENFENDFRKVFYLHGKDQQNNVHETKWIEGIGSTGLINTPGVMGDTVNMAELICASEYGKKAYSRKENDTCYSNPTFSIDGQNFEGEFYYSQSDAELIIRSEIHPLRLTLFDASGKIILHQTLLGEQNEVNLSHLKKGIYLAYLEQKSAHKTIKVLVE